MIAILCNNYEQYSDMRDKLEPSNEYRAVATPDDVRGLEFTAYIKVDGFQDYYNTEELVKNRIRNENN